MTTMEERVSRLKGIVEQVNERLGNLERNLEQGLEGVRAELRLLQAQMLGNFRWTLGILFAMWFTVIGAVLGALLAR